ncbi:MAG TPA: hypothetical protein VLA56_05595 [Pseudomonadales bacterium]|nr:hypothetical protein [Pseudomonadales bacterium]
MSSPIIVLICVLAVVGATVGGLWGLGMAAPSRLLTDETPLWFVALEGTGEDADFTPAAGVRQRWSSHTELVLIGPAPAWDRFLLLSGPAAADGLPGRLGAGVDDAWIARLEPQRPPALVLGALRAAYLVGLTSRAADVTHADGWTPPGRPELLPDADAVLALRTQPASLRPAMVNFLAYRDRAAYLRYGTVALRTVYGLGGELQFIGHVAEVVRPAHGDPHSADWDDIAVMRYPDPTAMLSMEQVPRYRASLAERDAGLETTRLIATRLAPR